MPCTLPCEQGEDLRYPSVFIVHQRDPLPSEKTQTKIDSLKRLVAVPWRGLSWFFSFGPDTGP